MLKVLPVDGRKALAFNPHVRGQSEETFQVMTGLETLLNPIKKAIKKRPLDGFSPGNIMIDSREKPW